MKVVPLTPTVSRFVLEKESGYFSKRMAPGQWATLELKMGKRTWTITSVREEGGWFSICVKNTGVSGKGGSRALHEAGTSFRAVLSDAGGSFSLQLQRTLVDMLEKRVLMISAGIGITPMLASLLTDPSTDRNTTTVLHVHCDRKLHDVVNLQALQNLCCDRPNHYKLKLFLSAHDEEAAGGEIVPRRFAPSDVPQVIETFASKRFLVMLCGPQEFMVNVAGELRRHGISDEHILMEDFS